MLPPSAVYIDVGVKCDTILNCFLFYSTNNLIKLLDFYNRNTTLKNLRTFIHVLSELVLQTQLIKEFNG